MLLTKLSTEREMQTTKTRHRERLNGPAERRWCSTLSRAILFFLVMILLRAPWVRCPNIGSRAERENWLNFREKTENGYYLPNLQPISSTHFFSYLRISPSNSISLPVRT